MSIEETLKSFLETQTSKSVFANEKPIGNNSCLVYKRVSTKPYRTHSGRSLEKTRIQINCYGQTKKGARDLAEEVKNNLDCNTSTFKTSILENDFDVKEIEENLYIVYLDFFIFE